MIVKFFLPIAIPNVSVLLGPNADMPVIMSADGGALPCCIRILEQGHQRPSVEITWRFKTAKFYEGWINILQ